MAPPIEHADFQLHPILEALYRHQVEYILVGGVAAAAHGATRPTFDFDCLAKRTRDNLDRLAAAMRELHARLRAEGVDDEIAKELPLQLDGDMLERMEISTWRTDAGDFDVLQDIPARDGHRLRYEDLKDRAQSKQVEGITISVASLADIIASKEWANRPKDHAGLPELRRIARTLGERQGDDPPSSPPSMRQ